MKSNRQLRSRLTGAFILGSFTISILYGLMVFYAMKYTEDDILTQRVKLEAQYFIDKYTRNKSTKLPHSIGLSSYLSTSSDLPEWLRGQPIGIRELHEREVHLGVFHLPHNDELLYIIVSEYDTSNLEKEISTLLAVLIFVGAIISSIGLIIGVLFSNYISTPLVTLTEEIEEIEENENNKISFTGVERNDEVGALSRAFARSLTRLKGFLEREKKFTRYVSHELRTPISLIRNSLAVLNLPEQNLERQKRNLARIDSAALDMESLINTFLLLGRESREVVEKPINIGKILSDCLEKNRYLNQDKNIDVVTVIDDEVCINCAPKIMSILIDNLVRNLYQYCHSKAIIKLNNRCLTLENNIDKDNAQDFRTNTYGLKIVEDICQLCGFTINTTNTESNFSVVLWFNK